MRLLIFNLRMDADDGVLGFTTDWVNALAARCEKIYVITMHAGRIDVATNVEVFSVGKERGIGRLAILVNLYRLTWRVLRQGRIDAVFAHMNYMFALAAGPLIKAFGKPVLLWFAHGSKPLLLRPTMWFVDRVVASSASGFQLPTAKLRVIGQGIDTDRFAPAPSEMTRPISRLLTLGRISRIKRLEIVIEALHRLGSRPDAPDLSCDLVGDPLTEDGERYQEELRELIQRLGLQRSVRLLPGVPFHSADRVMRDADLFINSADTDSVDKTVLEALSCGVPVITSNAAFSEIFPPVLKRRAIVPKNDIDALADAIQTLCRMGSEELATLQRLGRQTVVEQHSLTALSGKILNEIREIAPDRATSRRTGHA